MVQTFFSATQTFYAQSSIELFSFLLVPAPLVFLWFFNAKLLTRLDL